MDSIKRGVDPKNSKLAMGADDRRVPVRDSGNRGATY